MSATLAAHPYPHAGYSLSPLVSAEGVWLGERLESVRRLLAESHALAGHVRDVFDQLLDLYDECSLPEWDGADAVPVARESLNAAGCFLLSLPRDFPMPEVTADAQGEIHLEWYASPRRILTISFGATALHYAGRFGTSTTRGSEPVAVRVSEPLLYHIRRVFE